MTANNISPNQTEDKLCLLKERLQKLASKKCWSDNDEFNAYDYSGGNFDDAYEGGCHTGEILLARELLETLGETK